jgi:flagellar hook-associated protein 1
MSNLLATLVSSANALQAYGTVLETSQNNVANASTPGWAKQSVELYALAFDPQNGTTGGVSAGKVVSARDEFSETAVRQQTSGLGYQEQLVNSLTTLQAGFDVSGDTGIPLALNNLFKSFSSWGATPNSEAARETVIQRATDMAQAFQQASEDVATQETNADQQISQTVDQVNQLVARIQNYNVVAMQGGKNNAGLDANIHAALEDLSSVVEINASFQADGTVNVTLSGGTPLLLGDQQYKISSSLYRPQDPAPVNEDSPANVRIVAADGSDITSKTTGGQLGALLELRNQTLPSLIGDAYQAGSLNTMAKQFADRVNSLLTSGNISDGPPVVPGVALFTYDTANATNTAASLAVDSTVTGDQLAAISVGPPEVTNGVPLALAALASPVQDADKINGLSYNEFYGQIAGTVGSALSDATNNQDVQKSLLSQAKDIREQFQGVSLDEEATTLMQFQRAYQAASKFLTVLDQLTEVAINILST